MICLQAYSQDLSQVNSNSRFKNFCYSNKIYSAKIYKSDNQISDPIIKLNSGESISFMFDELLIDDVEEGNYYYTIIHCDADWDEETLMLNEYMSGFAENEFDEIRNSQKTMATYRHLKTVLPNAKVQFKISGNYLIKVFDRNRLDTNPLLVKGFSIVEPTAYIRASMMPQMHSTCNQQFDIKVDHRNLKVTDVYANLKLRIEQNSTRIPDTKDPIAAFIRNDHTDFTRMDRNYFNGRNEFRAFDIRSLLYNGQGVAGRYIKDIFEIYLVCDIEQSHHSSTKDIDGKYMIDSEYSISPETQSDYADVIFSFSPNQLIEGRVFLFSEFTDWSLSERFEMLFENGVYRCKVRLKQGFYNYQYVVVKPNGEIDFTTIEGCFYETKNTYNIFMYYRAPGSRYDALVGVKNISEH